MSLEQTAGDRPYAASKAMVYWSQLVVDLRELIVSNILEFGKALFNVVIKIQTYKLMTM